MAELLFEMAELSQVLPAQIQNIFKEIDQFLG
jgi:hypothetical protein